MIEMNKKMRRKERTGRNLIIKISNKRTRTTEKKKRSSGEYSGKGKRTYN